MTTWQLPHDFLTTKSRKRYLSSLCLPLTTDTQWRHKSKKPWKSGPMWPHYLFTIMNTPKKGTFQFCFPGLLGIHRNPKWKEFLRSRESFLKKVSICTLTDLNPGFGGPWVKFWIFLVNGTFIMLQKKSFGQKNFWISCTGSKHFLAKRLLLRHYESAIY